MESSSSYHSPSTDSLSFSSSHSPVCVSYWDYFTLLVLRPIFAISFIFFLIIVGWVVAWNLVLVHVPLVQEIFGLRKKTQKLVRPTRRFSQFYNSIDARNSASGLYRSSEGKTSRSEEMR